MNKELTIIFDRERFRFENPDGDVIVADALDADNAPVTIKGEPPVCGFQPGLAYRLFGRWTTYRNKYRGTEEKQFHFNSAVQAKPVGEAGVIAYLQQAPYIVEAKATRAWEEYGQEAVRVIREGDFDAVAKVLGLTGEKLEAARDHFVRHQRREESEIELVNLVQGQGLPKKTIRRAIDEWGTAAAEFIRKNPYRLMEFPGIGFRRCDAMYLALGHRPDKMRRQVLCSWYGISQQHSTQGHTWVRDAVARACVRGMIGGTKVDEDKAIRIGVRSGLLSAVYSDGLGGAIDEWNGDMRWLADSRKDRAEGWLSLEIVNALMDQPAFTVATEYEGLSDHQGEKIHELFSQSGCLFILGGGGGTGKSYTAATIIKEWIRKLGIHQVAVGAPSGKAAVRMTEAMSEYGIPLVAKTWHSLLGVTNGGSGGFQFHHNKTRPLPQKVVIGDEDSMRDTSLARSVFEARGKGTVFLILGDIHQLLPVGHGAPMRDMIASEVIPYAELTEVRRNSGEVAKQCQAIRDRGRFEITGAADSNLILRECWKPEQQVQQMLDELDQIDDPIWAAQVIVPTNNSGELGRKQLNKRLQDHLNSHKPIKGTPFRLRDKVVCTRNGWLKYQEVDHDAANVDEEKRTTYVANGDVGEVVECEPKRMVVKLESPYRVVVVGCSSDDDKQSQNDDDAETKDDSRQDTGCSWELAYAMSCHKCQGSQFDNVLVMLDDSPGARRLCTREWIYTAISRAAKRCVLIGSMQTALQMCRVAKIGERKTFLVERIHHELKARKRSAAAGLRQTEPPKLPRWEEIEV